MKQLGFYVILIFQGYETVGFDTVAVPPPLQLPSGNTTLKIVTFRIIEKCINIARNI